MQVMLNKPMRYEFRKVLNKAKNKGFLHEKTLQAIDREHYELTQNLLTQYNKGRSTCASQRIVKRIMKSIDYTIDHGLLYYANTIDTLQKVSITTLYDQGRLEIGERIRAVHHLQEELHTNQLPFFNERYMSILHQQLPSFLIPYEETNQYYSAYQCLEDFDYPLLDGLALINDNYHLKGIDFVLEYLQRLWIEQSFCLQFSSSDIAMFIEQYEIQKDVKVDMLGVNLCEILLTQHLFSNVMVSPHMLLTQNERTFIENILYSKCIDDTFIDFLFNKSLCNFPIHVQTYLYKYKVPFKELLNTMIPQRSITEWIIIPQEKIVTDFKLAPPCDPEVFQKLLDEMYYVTDFNAKKDLILQAPLGLYDYLDILNDNVLLEDELPLFFNELDKFQLALLFYVQNQELFRFHQMPVLSENELSKLDMHEIWEPIFYEYLSKQSYEIKNELQEAFRIIKTIDLSV